MRLFWLTYYPESVLRLLVPRAQDDRGFQKGCASRSGWLGLWLGFQEIRAALVLFSWLVIKWCRMLG